MEEAVLPLYSRFLVPRGNLITLLENTVETVEVRIKAHFYPLIVVQTRTYWYENGETNKAARATHDGKWKEEKRRREQSKGVVGIRGTEGEMLGYCSRPDP